MGDEPKPVPLAPGGVHHHKLHEQMKQMNRYGLWLGMVGGLLPMVHAAPTLFTDGVSFDTNNTAYAGTYLSFPHTDRTNLEFTSLNGGIALWSGRDESSRGANDGGVTILGTPVSIILQSNEFGQSERGSFSVWGASEYYGSSSTNKPLFEVNNQYNTAAFDSVAVTVTNGSLSVGGSPVLTAGGLNAALSTATPPVSWSSAYVARGNVSNDAVFASYGATASALNSFAIGSSATASGLTSFANGTLATASGTGSYAQGSNVVASGQFSSAQGQSSMASGDYSRALGAGANASAMASTAIGLAVKAQSIGEVVVGISNLTDPSPATGSWVGSDAVFRVGNGLGAERSDAITTRKHGETTLTNKFWKTNSANPLGDPVHTDDAGGSALVVDGHTTLNGKVTISAPQGDISMGIYQ